MSVVSMARELINEQELQAAWKLLRAKNAPAIIAILDAHLGGSVRKRPVYELVSLVEVDLEELRFRADLEFTRSAQAYCDAWRSDGYLVRRPVAQLRQETYELSSGALAAISFAKRLIQPRRSATQSRLNTIIDQINGLALATDHSEEHRRASLLEERDRIDQQLELLDQGVFEVLDADEALERLQDILSLSQEIPDDFVHVRNDFEQINKSLHATIIDSGEGYRDVLEDIFSGVDQISQSAAGRSFKGFYSLLRDADLTETVQSDIDAILDSDFSLALTADERKFLRGLLGNFTEQSQEVNTVMTSFARGLRRFVQSQEYQKERVLKQEIDQALTKAHALVDHYPTNHKMKVVIDLTAVPILPISRWKMKNPAESRAVKVEEVVLVEEESISLADLRALARETEIDFHELVGYVNACINDVEKESEVISISDVLKRFPATQGVASVIGLMVLAVDQGRISQSFEQVRWQTKNGQWRVATIELCEFFREVNQ